jgi:PiT family inorganic phosphate transporter
MMAAGSVQWTTLGRNFFLPLGVSPFVSLALTGILYPIFQTMRRWAGVKRQMCLCISGGMPQAVQVAPNGVAVLSATGLRLTFAQLQSCTERYQGSVFGIDAQWVLDRLHVLSAGVVSFARGLNDTPKIVALLIAASAVGLDLRASLLVVGAAMAAGGLLNARRVALTMSQRITSMNHGQGFAANLVTAFLVLFASKWGLPVSTTHVSCGSLFGLGAATRQGRWKTIRSILLSWVATLPIAAVSSAVVYRLATTVAR